MKKIQLLKTIVEISLVGLILFALFILIMTTQWTGKFNEVSERIPTIDGFDGIRFFVKVLPILTGLVAAIPIAIYFFILWTVRKILISMLEDSIFSWRQVALIRRLAGFYLVFTGVIFAFNLIRVLTQYFKGTGDKALVTLSAALGSSLSYLMTSLVAYVLAEIFIEGLKLKEDNELTV